MDGEGLPQLVGQRINGCLDRLRIFSEFRPEGFFYRLCSPVFDLSRFAENLFGLQRLAW